MHGEDMVLQVVKAAAASSTGMAASLISLLRLQEKLGDLREGSRQVPPSMTGLRQTNHTFSVQACDRQAEFMLTVLQDSVGACLDIHIC